MPHPSLEDDARDILAKAAFGLGRDPASLARATAVPEAVVMAALGKTGYPTMGDIPEAVWLALAGELGLHGPSLIEIAKARYHPDVRLPEGMACISTRQRMLEVNAWVLADLATGRALIFDTGADARPLLGHLARHHLKAEGLFLTHDHVDHVVALPEIRAALPDLVVYSPALDHAPGTKVLPEAGVVETYLGPVRCLPTPGHTDGGTSYFLAGAPGPICIVGDALFAGSIGGPKFSYPMALESIRKKLLSLPGETILCPGHGPATTIALETFHNPFLVKAS